jgi:hypothetical protein
MLELDDQHGGLQLVETEVATDQRMVVLRFSAVDAQDSHAFVQGSVVADTHAGVAERAEVFRRKKRQAADIADAAGAPAVRERGTDGLRRVFDDREPILARDAHECVHVGHLAVQVDRHQRLDRPTRRAVDEPVATQFAALG